MQSSKKHSYQFTTKYYWLSPAHMFICSYSSE